jgi:hypothetical protein
MHLFSRCALVLLLAHTDKVEKMKARLLKTFAATRFKDPPMIAVAARPGMLILLPLRAGSRRKEALRANCVLTGDTSSSSSPLSHPFFPPPQAAVKEMQKPRRRT